jgi:type I restriction enzyme S subunit
MTLQPTSVADLVDAGRLAIGDGYRAKNVELGEPGMPFLRVANLNDGFDMAAADCLDHMEQPVAPRA